MRRIILVSLFLSLILSCSKKDNCTEEVLAYRNFETDNGCIDTRHSLGVDLTNYFTVIRSKATYDSEVSGPCHPDIDFTLYDLVIGKQATKYLVDTISYDYKRTCPDKELELTVEITQVALIQPDTVVYHAILPKIGDEETLHITLNVR